MTANPSDRLLAAIVARARSQAPVPLRVACGLGGGGPVLVSALAQVVQEHPDRSARTGADAGGLVANRRRDAKGGAIVDLTSDASAGGREQSPEPIGTACWTVVLTCHPGPSVERLASFGGPGADERLFCELLQRECSAPHESAAALAGAFGCATALIPDLRDAGLPWDQMTAIELVQECWRLPWLSRLRTSVTERGGAQAYDLGRVLALMRPAEIEVSDEWAMLATALSGRVYSISDIAAVLHTLVDVFELAHEKRRLLVRPSSRLAKQLLLGGIPASSSEHYAVYRSLRERAIAVLDRKDDSDRFVTRQLPRQASAAGALAELVADPLSILCSDPLVLLRELEAHPALLRAPAGKVVSLSAHRLLSLTDRASQLELSARRVGLHKFADSIAEQLPSRRWRSSWAQAEVAHTHRVAFNHAAPLLTVAVPKDAGETAYVGGADGEIWRISPYRYPVCLHGSRYIDGEIRALAAFADAGRQLVAFGTSTHAVGVIDGVSGEIEWLDAHAHHDPLSAIAIAPGDEPTVLSAGVGGQIHAHPLADGTAGARMLHEHGSEIRGLSVVRIDDADVVVFCAVDSVVGLVSLADDTVIASWDLGKEVLNDVAAAVVGPAIRLVTGTSCGSLLETTLALNGLLRASLTAPRPERWRVLSEHPLAVNAVCLHWDGDELAVLSGASDGSWRWHDSSGVRQAGLGHVGPIWSMDCLAIQDRCYVVTAGAEGACRLWLTQAVLDERITRVQPLAHNGPVTAIELCTDTAGEVVVITGGNDGDVRLATPSLRDNGGLLMTSHDNEISALLDVEGTGGDIQIVSGSVDGTLRVTPLVARHGRGSRVLGIAHEGVTALCQATTDSKHVISGGRDGTITFWDLGTSRPTRTVQACRYGGVQALCHINNRGEGLLVVGGQDGAISVYHPSTFESRGQVTMLEASVLRLCQLPDSSNGVLAAMADGRVAVLRDLGLYGGETTYIQVSDNEIRGLATLIIGGRLFVCCAGLDRHLRLLDVATSEESIGIELDGYSFCLSSSGSSIGLGTSAGASVISYATDILTLNL